MKTSAIEVGDIVIVDLDPTRGAEKRKTRPCVVLEARASSLGLFLAVPITEDKGQRSELFVRIDNWRAAGLSKPSVVDSYQIRAMDHGRIVKRLGGVTDEVLDRVRRNLANLIGIDAEHLA